MRGPSVTPFHAGEIGTRGAARLRAALPFIPMHYGQPSAGAPAAAIACGIAIGVMMALGCLHPSGGAVALTAVLGGPSIQAAGYGFAIWPIAVSSLLLLGAALAFNHLMPRAAKMA